MHHFSLSLLFYICTHTCNTGPLSGHILCTPGLAYQLHPWCWAVNVATFFSSQMSFLMTSTQCTSSFIYPLTDICDKQCRCLYLCSPLLVLICSAAVELFGVSGLLHTLVFFSVFVICSVLLTWWSLRWVKKDWLTRCMDYGELNDSVKSTKSRIFNLMSLF